MTSTTLIAVALVVLGYGLFSKRFERGLITPPMVFVLAGFLVGGRALGVVDMEVGEEAIHLFAELTLILVLFTDAATIDLQALRRDLQLPVRLLGIGMPLTILLGALIGKLLFPQFSIFEAALLAAVLAPTDAALGKAVVSNETVPGRVRRTLNVESGFNDGIALPVILVLAACAESQGQEQLGHWLTYAVKQVGLGPLVGLLVGFVGGKLVQAASESSRMIDTFQRLAGLALAILSYGVAEAVGGNGFIAAFVAGLVVGNTVHASCHGLYQFAETEGELLSLVTFLLFGAVLVHPASAHWGTSTWIYAGLSLTVVRMLPVSLSLLGSGVYAWTHVFIGWFGPRGLASILFGLLIIKRTGIVERELIEAVAIATVLLSVFAHGLTASPLAERYGLWVQKRHREDATADSAKHRPEMHPPGSTG